MLNGLKNFLQIINDNWTTILVIIGLLIGLWKKIENYISKSDEEKIEIAKKQIANAILEKITIAEQSYSEWSKAGQIKRSKVIAELYQEYPILSKVVDQAALTAYIDKQIDESLKILRETLEKNNMEHLS